MFIELSSYSKKNVEIIEKMISPETAARYLKEKLTVRSFSEMLSTFYKQDDILEKIVKEFLSADADAVAESVRKKVKNWLAGKSIPQNREVIFIIAFALGFDENHTSLILGMCTGYGIHYRNAHELKLAYCLRTKKTYTQAVAFCKTLTEVSEQSNEIKTKLIEKRFADIYNDTAFVVEYQNCLNSLGQSHKTAYEYFDMYYSALFDREENENYLSIEAATEEYFRLNMPEGKKHTNYSNAQKLLKASWPSATSITNIKNRREEVTRKILLLFYIITENVIDGEYHELDEEYIEPEDIFNEHWWNINLMLSECGMPLLDPRNNFDWLILYSLRIFDESEGMSERFAAVIGCLFNDSESDVGENGSSE